MSILLKLICSWVSAVPLSSALKIGKSLGWIYGHIVRYHRQDALEALQQSFPEKSDGEIHAIANSMYRNLGMNLVESLRIGQIDDAYIEACIEFQDQQVFADCIQKGGGSLGLMAHIGNWELLSVIPYTCKHPTTIIAKTIKNKAVNEVLHELREKVGLHILPAQHSYRACLEALKKNEFLGFVLDQNMIRDEGVFVDFFGRPACTSPGLAYLSAQTRLPVHPVFIIRQNNGRHLVKVYPPIPPPAGRDPDSIHQATQQYTTVIEEVIRKVPEQWIWIHRRWRTQSVERSAG